MTESFSSNSEGKDLSKHALSLQGIGAKVPYDEAVSFILHCSASPQAKMKLAFLWGTQSDAGCVALQLLQFLQGEFVESEDFVTGRKAFEIDGWLLENQDDEEISTELEKYRFVLDYESD
jgi:hypothetical protein